MLLDRGHHLRRIEGGQQHQVHAVEQARVHDHVAVDVRAGEGGHHRVLRGPHVHDGGHRGVHEDVAVAVHGALGMPGGAGGVADGREGVGGHRGDLHVRVPGGQEVFEGPAPRRRGVVAEEDDLAKAPASAVAACASRSAAPEPEQWLALLARREQNLGAAVVDDEADLLRRQHHVDRVGDRAQLVDRVVAHHPLPGVVGVQGDPVARLDADVAQAVGEPVRELVQHVEAEPAAVEYERRLVAEPAGRRGQHLTECLQHAASSGVDFAMTRPAGEGCASAMAEPIPLCTVLPAGSRHRPTFLTSMYLTGTSLWPIRSTAAPHCSNAI